MKLENQVVSLDLAKRLKELGVKQESYFEWQRYDFGWILSKAQDHAEQLEYISAFTVAELGEMLPSNFHPYTSFDGEITEHDVDGVFFRTQKVNETWICEDYAEDRQETASTEADARAKMLIYLIENNLYETKEE